MTLDELIQSLPAYAKDIKLNFSTLVGQNTELTPTQLWGSVLVSAISVRQSVLTQAVLAAAATHLPEPTIEAAKTAAAIMGMNNIFYRFHHLTTNEKYATLPARLRMNGIRTHGADPVDFELWCVAASAVNGCGKCVDAHEQVLRQKGMTEETILAAVRIAALFHAVGTVLDAESGVREPAAIA